MNNQSGTKDPVVIGPLLCNSGSNNMVASNVFANFMLHENCATRTTSRPALDFPSLFSPSPLI